MKRITRIILTMLLLAVAPAGILSGSALAACPGGNTSQGQVLEGIGQTGSKCSDSQLTETLAAVVNIMSWVVGVAAVIVIIYSGLKYITAAGEAGKVSSAKSTLIYALVGLVLAAVAQFLVHFVLFQAGKAT